MTVNWRRGVVALACALAALAGLSGQSAPDHSVLNQLAATWAATQDFTLDIDARERDGERSQERKMHYWYLRPTHAKLQLLDGPHHGTTLVWNGGDRMYAYLGGLLSLIKKRLDLNDPSARSIRGNSIKTPILGPMIACFEAHRSAVTETSGPVVHGEATDEVTLRIDDGLQCPEDSPQDRNVSRDVLNVSRVSHLPVRRVRYIGAEEVERWELSRIKINTGLRAEDFK